jgi:hypothetical protein
MSAGQLDDDWVGPCQAMGRNATADHPHESWDLDVGDVQSWLRAQRVCLEQCPFLVACRHGERGCTRIRRGTRRR